MKKFFLLTVALFLLAACQPWQTKADAEAFASTSKANQDALDRDQLRARDQQEHGFQMAKEQWWLELRESYKPYAQAAAQGIVDALGLGLIVFTLAAFLSGSWGIIQTARAYETFIHLRATIRGRAIPMDRVTRSFPLLPTERGTLAYSGKGILTLTNPNDNSILTLDTSKEADRQKIAEFGLQNYVAVLLSQIAKMEKPGDAAIFTPHPATSIKDKVIEITAGE